MKVLEVVVAKNKSSTPVGMQSDQWRTQENISGFKIMVCLEGGAGESAKTQRIFENLGNFLKKIANLHYFSLFFKKFKNR